MKKRYCVTCHVGIEGDLYVEVLADSPDEARKIAEAAVNDVDFVTDHDDATIADWDFAGMHVEATGEIYERKPGEGGVIEVYTPEGKVQ